MKHIKLFEGFVDDNEKLYNKITYSPREITIELTQIGKQKIEEQLKAWVRRSRPSYQTGGYIPRTRISIKDEVKIKASYFGGPNDSGIDNERNRGKMVNIGEVMIDEEPGFSGRWITDSPLTKTGEGDGKHSSGSFIIFARYFPLEDESRKGAKISLTESIYKSKDQWSEKVNSMQTFNDCEFSKVEPGEVDDRGWFKIVSVN